MPWPVRMTLTISVAVLPLYLYIGWRFGTALIKRFHFSALIVRIFIFLLMIWMYILPFYFVFTAPENHFTGNLQTGWPDYLILLPFWYGLIIVVESFPYFILLDLTSLALRARNNERTAKWKNWLDIIRIAVFLFFIIYVPVRSQTDTNSVKLNQKTLAVDGLPEALDGLALSLIADVQVDRYTQMEKLTEMRRLLDQSDSEMLFFAGDIVTSGEEYIRQAVEALCGSQTFAKRIACLGDHDFWSDAISIQKGLENCGWLFLDNQHQVIDYKGKHVLITGITHIYSRRIAPAKLKLFLASAPDADYKILLVHQPAEFLVETAAEYGYNLFLAGHTHGGQIVFRPFGFPLTPSQRETRFYSGYFRVEGMDVIVSNGIGLTLAPIRYHSNAEVFTVKLSRAEQ